MLSQEIMKLERENEALKRAVEAMRKFGTEEDRPKACEYCKFYIQHYVKTGCSQYTRTHCGHCTHGRIKDKKPNDSCKYFELGTYETKRIV